MIYLRPERGRGSAQTQVLQTAISSGLLQTVQLAAPAELKVHSDLIQILGSGEAACLSPAECLL